MSATLTNFVAYLPSPDSQPRIGHLDFSINCIIPLSFPSGTYLTSLNQVINADKEIHFIPSSQFDVPVPLSSVTLLPPLPGRDVLAVGKNYSEHAKEFNSSGYDSSDKVDIPTHPVIFTKRASSIIACGEDIFPHEGWTKTLDYEGEIGVILGREGFKIAEEDAWDYVWGFTIINDITARDRQRDHKQFFLGKSADTFCPMGPIAVPLTSLPHHKSLRLVTRVNNELRQDSNLTQLIFSIPTLIATISSALTIQPGDVLATGTPAGVGIGRKTPIFLKTGDTISVSVSGLGTLTNTVAAANSPPTGIRHLPAPSSTGEGLIWLASSKKFVHIERQGNLSSSSVIVFIHGLGGSTRFYHPAIDAVRATSTEQGRLSELGDKQLLIYDLEGHGLSPTTPESVVSIASYATDLRELITTLGLEKSFVSIFAHSLGCLIALKYHDEYNDIFSDYAGAEFHVPNLFLTCPPLIPTPDITAIRLLKRAEKVRRHGIMSIVDEVIAESMTTDVQLSNPLIVNYARSILTSTDPEGYAKGCTAWATAQRGPGGGGPGGDPRERLNMTSIVVFAGTSDKVISSDEARKVNVWLDVMSNSVLDGGHWCPLENYHVWGALMFSKEL